MSKQSSVFDPTEKQLESAILSYLKYEIGVFAFKVNTTGVYDPRVDRFRTLSKHVVAGTPDIIACVSVEGRGLFVGMEVKKPGGKPSQNQKEFQERLQDRANGWYFIVRSVDDAKRALQTVRSRLVQEFMSEKEPPPPSYCF